MKKNFFEFLESHPALQHMTHSERLDLARSIKQEYLVGALSGIIRDVEEIIEIDSGLEEKSILEIAAEKIANILRAEAASIRLFDPKSMSMTCLGTYQISEAECKIPVPFEDSISGQVVRENRSISISSLLKDPRFKIKNIVKDKGVNSLLAVCLQIPKFLGSEEDVLGSIQIYYKEDNRKFDPFEIIHAELLARRISFVLAKRKILALQSLNAHKENMVDRIFVKLSNREGIKLKDLFVDLIPELDPYLQVKSCSLFSVSKDQKFIRVEAGYPLDKTYHQPGYTFTVSHHPYFQTAIHGVPEYGDHPFERIDPAYFLIKDPERSQFTSLGMREFVEKHHIYSILIIPLKVNGITLYLMTFYATEQKSSFTNEEIDLLTFFGKEVMKALRLELLDDVLHDFKNPAIAITGFASRARNLMESEDLEGIRNKLVTYLDIILKETVRMQDMALAMRLEGREEVLDLSEIAGERFRLNEETIRQSWRRYIRIEPPEIKAEILVYCSRFGLERVLDNLMNNAVNAIPKQGGSLAMRCYVEETMACLEIRNTGDIPEEKIDQVKKGEVRGRGLNIIYRFVQGNHGKIDIRAEDDHTVIVVKLPLFKQKSTELTK
ncbi:MAG: GAF domain-containing sensor histidine kinase [Deltaproteobacteria bacterium]|nr:GAF domain-containing sensor histidine kinase [Deltaproteobacteria bacterium]MBW1719152.1 GAF domain-containing sensor histidine kinase [Deltaproteobacteria bacterium]MBW1932552.1 GAF domain-containing sensor histidine kinase [Deltaproteobacteria bacterium]MBW1938702.1 GAF domain-containing sensor histidine kinase [Deltaproteobacteria bacterium]MBW1965000.1 GAF domain-containing sensor histidine kinase [Deltaproteobacteria bacterium]